MIRTTGIHWNADTIEDRVDGMLSITNLNNLAQAFDPNDPIKIRHITFDALLALFTIIAQSNHTITVYDVQWTFYIHRQSYYIGNGGVRRPPWLTSDPSLTLAFDYKMTWEDQPATCAAFVIAYKTTSRPSQNPNRVIARALEIQEQLGWTKDVSFYQIGMAVQTHFRDFRFSIIIPTFDNHQVNTFDGPDFKYQDLPGIKEKIIYFLYYHEHYAGCNSPLKFLQGFRKGRRWCHGCVTYFDPNGGCNCGVKVKKIRIKPPCKFCGKKNCKASECFRTCRFCGGSFKGGYTPQTGHRCIVWQESKGTDFWVPGDTLGGKNSKPKLWVYDLESAIIRSEHESTIDFVCDETGFVMDEGKVRVSTIRVAHHSPNLVVFRNVFDEESEETFFGEDALHRFILKMVTDNDGNNICIAHNGSGYDTRLIFEEIVKQQYPYTMEPISRGTKFMQLKVGKKTVFKDSLLFLPSSLANLAKSFDLPMRKGIFPHLFNSVENYDYEGPLPPKSMFDLSFYAKSQKDIDTFNTWYEERSKTPWVFQDELVNYCRDDVAILAMIVRKFNDICVDKFQISPWLSTTAPSYVHKVITSILTESLNVPDTDQPFERAAAVNDLARTEHWAVLLADEYWFAREALRGGRTDARRLQYTLTPDDIANGRKIAYVDVVSLYPSVQVKYEYPVGLPTINIYDDKMYPCRKHENPEYGNTRKVCDCPIGSKRRSVNTMLNIIEHREQPSHQYLMDESTFGFICASLTPPKTLFHPVLVTWDEARNKCIASLEPIIEKVFTTVEFKWALGAGYKLDKVHRIDIYNRKDGLWNDFIKDLYIEKLANSGPPPPPEDRQAIIDAYEEHFQMGAAVEESFPRWKRDGALRTVFKTLLNCGWGKHCQRPSLAKLTMLNSSSLDSSLFDNVQAKTVKINSITHLNNTTMISTTDNGLNTKFNFHSTYLPAGVFVPSYGRMTLYKEMYMLDKRVLYHDTDSIIYIYDPKEYNIPQSSLWGDWDEEDISKKGITSFVSLGPKSYGLRAPGQDIIKLKGLSIKHAHRNQITFDLLKEQIDAFERGEPFVTEVPQMNFVYAPGKGIKTTYSLKKLQFQPELLKGFLGPESIIYPLGYCQDCAFGRDHDCQ
jgi:hypothetical protein